jgi:hypothetical protein
MTLFSIPQSEREREKRDGFYPFMYEAQGWDIELCGNELFITRVCSTVQIAL